MSLNRNVGEIVFPSGRKCILWKIPNFSLVYVKLGFNQLRSPTFSLFSRIWYFIIDLNDEVAYSSRFGSLFIVMRNPVSSFTMTFKLGYKYDETELGMYQTVDYITRTFTTDTNIHGFDDDFLRGALKKLIRKGKRNVTLEIYCDIASVNAESLPVFSDAACQTASLYGTICRDFHDLLLSERKSDVTMEVRGHDFKAHRFILEACSPTFAAMFGHDMAEKNSGVVQIDDCDPDTFQNFLKCVYTGKMEKLSSDNLINLYVLADKYSVSDIKVKCAELLEEDLSVDTACDVLALADTYNETRLKHSAEEFLVQNMKIVVCTEKWKSLLEVNTVLGNNVFMKFCNNISS